MKPIITLPLTLFLVSATVHANPQTVPLAQRIVPGKSVGSLRIGANDDVEKRFGEPTFGDAASGRYWSYYRAKTPPHYELAVFSTVSEDDSAAHPDRTIKTIRVMSPYFRTADGITPTSPWKTIRAHYPRLKPVERWVYTDKSGAHYWTVYDDQAAGIAFEIGDGVVNSRALYIHKPGEPVMSMIKTGDAWKRLEDSVPEK